MAFELQAIVYTTLILFVLLLLQGTLVPLTQGFGWGLGSRDAPMEKTAIQGRVARTTANHIEGMFLFIPLVIVAELSGLSSSLTALGAGLYVAGRVAFAPFYLFGVPYLRSAAWAVSITGILLIGFEVVKTLF